MHPALKALHDYYGAFSSLQLSAIVSYFCEPCMSVGPQGVFSVGTRTELAHALTALVEGLRAKGYEKSEFTDPQLTTLTEQAVLLKGNAVRYLAGGQELERLSISYLLSLTSDGWKIAVMVLDR